MVTITTYIYPDNLKAKATLWLWALRDVGVLAVSGLLSVGDGMIQWNVVMAGNVFLFAPMLIIYLLANRSIKQAFIYGGIK